jgi:hypothetical protein
MPFMAWSSIAVFQSTADGHSELQNPEFLLSVAVSKHRMQMSGAHAPRDQGNAIRDAAWAKGQIGVLLWWYGNTTG